MTNKDVCFAWYGGKVGDSANLHTDGKNLFSYRLKIGRTDKNGLKIVLLYIMKDGISHTTNAHINLAYGGGYLLGVLGIAPTKNDITVLRKIMKVARA